MLTPSSCLQDKSVEPPRAEEVAVSGRFNGPVGLEVLVFQWIKNIISSPAKVFRWMSSLTSAFFARALRETFSHVPYIADIGCYIIIIVRRAVNVNSSMTLASSY